MHPAPIKPYPTRGQVPRRCRARLGANRPKTRKISTDTTSLTISPDSEGNTENFTLDAIGNRIAHSKVSGA
jgi:hypothetical protein